MQWLPIYLAIVGIGIIITLIWGITLLIILRRKRKEGLTKKSFKKLDLGFLGIFVLSNAIFLIVLNWDSIRNNIPNIFPDKPKYTADQVLIVAKAHFGEDSTALRTYDEEYIGHHEWQITVYTRRLITNVYGGYNVARLHSSSFSPPTTVTSTLAAYREIYLFSEETGKITDKP